MRSVNSSRSPWLRARGSANPWDCRWQLLRRLRRSGSACGRGTGPGPIGLARRDGGPPRPAAELEDGGDFGPVIPGVTSGRFGAAVRSRFLQNKPIAPSRRTGQTPRGRLWNSVFGSRFHSVKITGGAWPALHRSQIENQQKLQRRRQSGVPPAVEFFKVAAKTVADPGHFAHVNASMRASVTRWNPLVMRHWMPRTPDTPDSSRGGVGGLKVEVGGLGPDMVALDVAGRRRGGRRPRRAPRRQRRPARTSNPPIGGGDGGPKAVLAFLSMLNPTRERHPPSCWSSSPPRVRCPGIIGAEELARHGHDVDPSAVLGETAGLQGQGERDGNDEAKRTGHGPI